ncbi:MAG: hypothetical protein NTZ09_09180 [Candidatus Hydrogenedentes bacterium]|nr:hypothetical protein [Candidatus Hydrogenedentota bacterium]
MRALKKGELKLQNRQQAFHKVHPTSGNVGADRKYREQVEAGRKELGIISAQGGDNQAKQVRQELMYLLNNYLPQYDMRIEQLIDLWRRSHDPAYDPSVRVKYRQVRKDYMSKGGAV